MIRDSEARVLQRLVEDENRGVTYISTRGLGRLLARMVEKRLVVRSGYAVAPTEVGRLRLLAWRPKPRPEP